MIIKLYYYTKKRIQYYINKNSFYHFGKNSYIDKRLTSYHNRHLISIENSVRFRYGSRIEAFDNNENKGNPKVIINSGTTAGNFLHIGAVEKVEIGKNCLLGSNILITDHNHIFTDTNIPIMLQGIESKGEICIGDNCWIGDNVVILPGAKVGKNSVIAANSVVNCIIPENTVFGGIPAKLIKEIRSN